jgi:hypothetical protein
VAMSLEQRVEAARGFGIARERQLRLLRLSRRVPAPEVVVLWEPMPYSDECVARVTH